MDSLHRLSDAELLAITESDADAFGVFYERHGESVLAYLWRRTGDAEVALDLTAEVFAAALDGSHRYDAELGPARGWLFGIASNTLAASRRRQALEIEARARLGVPRLEFSEEMLERVEERIDAGEAGFVAGLDRLGAAERSAIAARVIDERDYADIARSAATSEAAIRQRVSRGLSRLAQMGRRPS